MPPLATAIIATPSATQGPSQLADNLRAATPPIAGAAGSLARATPTATVTGPFFPLPLPANAGVGSPLGQTQPLSAGVALRFAGAVSAAAPPLPVLTPVPHQIAVRDLLQSYGFTPLRPIAGSESLTSFSAQVSVVGHRYRASMIATSYGYHLLLQQAAPISPSVTPAPGFDAVAAATAFMHQHQLDTTLAEDAASAGAGGAAIHFATRIPYEVHGGGATLVYSVTGILQSADIRLMDDSAPVTIPAISEQAALAAATSGQGLVQTTGGVPLDATSNITGTTLIYTPVEHAGVPIFEPMYQFIGMTASGSPFAIYVPALDRAYLKP